MAVVFDSRQQSGVNQVKAELLKKSEEAKQFFLENFCEDKTDGTVFDCRVLDKFDELERFIKGKFDYDKIR